MRSRCRDQCGSLHIRALRVPGLAVLLLVISDGVSTELDCVRSARNENAGVDL